MTPISDKHEEIKYAAENLFATNPDWVKFYREVMGLHGVIRQAFPTLEEMAEFEQTETYGLVHRLVTELRQQPLPKELEAGEESEEAADDEAAEEEEETRVITVRIPKSMHDVLRTEAYQYRTSMNKLCISKLLHFIDTEHVPTSLTDKAPKGKKKEAGL